MDLMKERNIIYAYERGERLGGWNITTGEFIGKSGKVVKSNPSCFVMRNLYNFPTDILSGAIRFYRDCFHNYRPYTPERGNRLEQMISVGIYPAFWADLDSTEPLTKDLVDWIKTNKHNVYESNAVTEYIASKNYLSKLPNNPPTWAMKVIGRMVGEKIPSTYFIPAVRRAIHENWDYLTIEDYRKESDIFYLLFDYYKQSMAMWGKVEVKPNLLTAVCTVRKLHKEYMDKHNDELIKLNNDLPWLYFENDNYIVRPLLSKEEFHKEAVAQHNCVESMYMSEVREGKTHVVTVRHKDTPNVPHITCEVNNKGTIVQYYLAFNYCPKTAEDIAFNAIYQQHLTATFPKDES